MRRPAFPPAMIEEGEAGLTLVEMIVALALGALVVAFLAQGTGLIRNFGRLGAAVSAQDETLAVRDHLRETIASALGAGAGSQGSSFAGVGDTVVFTAPGDQLLEMGGPIRITLAALPDGSHMSLIETRAPVGGSGDARQRTRRLVSGAVRVGFSYFGTMSGDTAAAWSTEWTDPQASPRLMRIDIAFPPGDGRRWPPFVVLMPSARPAADAPAAEASASAAPLRGTTP